MSQTDRPFERFTSFFAQLIFWGYIFKKERRFLRKEGSNEGKLRKEDLNQKNLGDLLYLSSFFCVHLSSLLAIMYNKLELIPRSNTGVGFIIIILSIENCEDKEGGLK